MLNLLIFSKDRGCQLDLLLRSIKHFWTDWSDYKFFVLYKYSNEWYKEGYRRVIKKHPDINYIKEINFKNQVVSQLHEENKFTMYLVDDNVFKEQFKFNCEDVFEFYKNEDIACLSLRLHPRIKYCYTIKIDTPPPKFINKNSWVCAGALGDWNYKMSVDGHIFRTKDVVNLVKSLNYSNPNTFEGMMASNELKNPLMMCFEKSIIFNIPVNKVQTVNGNYCGGISAEYLNTKFLDGYIINLEPIKNFDNISVHQEIDLKLVS